MGLDQAPLLFRVLDKQVREVTLAPGGLTISEKLAELLDVKTGEEMDLQILEGRRERRTATVAATFPDYSSPGAYMRRSDLHRLLREGECVSGVFLAVITFGVIYNCALITLAERSRDLATLRVLGFTVNHAGQTPS